jgi:hypothetical protein
MGGARVPDWAAERRPFLLGATGAINATTLAYVFVEEAGRRSVAKAHQGRGAANRGEYCQAAGAIAQSVKAGGDGSVSVSAEKETRDEKQAQHFAQCQI